MSRCDGLPPDGRCPHSASGRQVKPTQGELMLCGSCDATSFPRIQGSTGSTTQCPTRPIPAKNRLAKRIMIADNNNGSICFSYACQWYSAECSECQR